MKVLVDSCIWSLALRRKHIEQSIYIDEFKELITEVRVQIIGAVRQEILSGIKLNKHFEILRSSLSAFDDLALSKADYETAANYFNLLRSKGIQGSNTDFLICAVSVNHELPIFTLDKDFTMFQKYIPIQLHNPRNFG